MVPHLWKADIDSAFRRIPVKPDDRWLCGIAFMVDGQVMARLMSAFIVSPCGKGMVGTASRDTFRCSGVRACVGACGGSDSAYC